MYKPLFLLLALLSISCIPIRIAPSITDHKVMVAKKFKRDLPKNYAFVFEDTKEAEEFYRFVDSKNGWSLEEVDKNVPLYIEDEVFHMSFYEREKTTETINLIPIVVDGLLDSDGKDPIFEEVHTSRNGNWYIVITIDDDEMKDALDPTHEHQQKVIDYLKRFKQDYYSIPQYSELSLSKMKNEK